jgi:hypothetical protein
VLRHITSIGFVVRDESLAFEYGRVLRVTILGIVAGLIVAVTSPHPCMQVAGIIWCECDRVIVHQRNQTSDPMDGLPSHLPY